MGPVRCGTTTVFRYSLMRPSTVSAALKKYPSTPMFGAGRVMRPGTTYAPGDHMKYPPNVWMLFENLMLSNVSTIQCSFWASGSESSEGPAKTSLVHED